MTGWAFFSSAGERKLQTGSLGPIYVVGAGSNPAYQNSWVAYDSTTYYGARYYKDSAGIVHIEGLVKSGTVNDGVAIFTLPVGFRPDIRHLFPVVTNPNTIGRCDVHTDGKVCATTGNNAWFGLSGITFRAA